jgi:uncharacterized protein YycO
MKEFILKLFKPFIILIGKLHYPIMREYTISKDLNVILNRIEIGDVILTYSGGQISNFFNKLVNPGKYMHAAIYAGKQEGIPYIVEAVGAGVVYRPYIEFLWDKRYIAILSPKEDAYPTVYRKKAVEWAKKQEGKPYDYMFDIGDESEDALYCSELVYAAYKHAYPGFGFVRKYKGADKVVPNDYYRARKFFNLIYETKRGHK